LQNKELCGFDDVLRQCYCVDLASKYHNLVTISFFKKFQSSIVICNSFTPSIKTGVYLRIEWFLGVIYSIHLILIAGLFIFLSALGNKELSFGNMAFYILWRWAYYGYVSLFQSNFPLDWISDYWKKLRDRKRNKPVK
jgi:hypothetical protein